MAYFELSKLNVV